MAVKTKTVLKTFFEQGDIPTQGQYSDLIDSMFGLGEAGVTQIIQGTVSASAAEIESMTFKTLYLPGLGIDSMKVGTTFRVGQTLEVSGSINVEEGNIITTGNVTASGNMEAAKYHSIGRNLLRYKTNWSASIVGTKSHDTLITGSTIQLGGKIVNGTSTVSDCHVTASANFSASGDITGKNITATGNTILGDGLADTHTFTGNITASNASFLSGSFTSVTSSNATFSGATNHTGFASFTNGIRLSHESYDVQEITWTNGDTFEFNKRKGKIRFENLPELTASEKRYSGEYMYLLNSQITVDSVVLMSHSTHNNSTGRYVGMHVSSVIDGRATLIPYNFYFAEITAGGSADYSFVIL